MAPDISDEIELNLAEVDFDDSGRIVLPAGAFADQLQNTIDATNDEIGTLKLKINGSCPSINNHCS